VTVLTGLEKGKYPHGNSMLVEGSHQTILIDPSLTVADRGTPRQIDRIFLSHVHEDHVPGMTRLKGVPVSCHEADAVGLTSIDGLMSMYGLPPAVEREFRQEVIEDFSYEPRSDVSTFSDGEVFDLGGVEIQVIHTPGHTRGHCAFLIPQARTAFLGDIELSGFGPYYFDAHSSLDSFEHSLNRCRSLDADHFVTFHHKWVISGRELFLQMLDDFENVISNRELAMLDFMSEPKSVNDCASHRFVYRPSVDMNFVDHVETRSAQIHIARMIKQGRVLEVSEGSYLSV
jgi:glyoxylase-like metal-dependent hydrolase (beta-lactamase superfamily II)